MDGRFSTNGGHTQRQWEGKFFQCKMECWYCRLPLTLDGATKDHKIPLSRGGSDAIGNIVPACIDCNRLKSDLTEEEFRLERKLYSTEARELTSSTPFEPSTMSRDRKDVDNSASGEIFAVRAAPELVAAYRREAAEAYRAGNIGYADSMVQYADSCEFASNSDRQGEAPAIETPVLFIRDQELTEEQFRRALREEGPAGRQA